MQQTWATPSQFEVPHGDLQLTIEKIVAGALPAICRRCLYMAHNKRGRLAGGSPSARSEQDRPVIGGEGHATGGVAGGS